MSNYLVIVIPTNSTIIDMNNHDNQATKAHDSLNSIVDKIQKLNGGGKSGTIIVSTTATAPTVPLSGTGAQTNTFTF